MSKKFQPVGLIFVCHWVMSHFRDDTKLPGGLVESRLEQDKLHSYNNDGEKVRTSNRVKNSKIKTV